MAEALTIGVILNDATMRELVESLRRHEPQAMRAVYELLKNDVMGVAAVVLGAGAAREAAWDVLHDVFVSLARSCRTLAPDSDLRAYLTRAAANRARDWLRRNRRMLTSVDLAEPASAGTDVLDLIERDEETAELLRALAKLPEEQRVVVGLRVWGGLGFAQIGQLECISENTAQSRWRYAIEKLRKHLQGVQQ
jgi:RNA polymerase sigma-70 factor (ECF subfamily)